MAPQRKNRKRKQQKPTPSGPTQPQKESSDFAVQKRQEDTDLQGVVDQEIVRNEQTKPEIVRQPEEPVCKPEVITRKMDDKKPKVEKSKEEIMAEREAKKAAKLAAKNAAKVKAKVPSKADASESKEPEESKKGDKNRDEVMAAREAKKAAKKDSQPKKGGDGAPESSGVKDVEKSGESGKTKAELKAERRAKQEAQRAAKQQASGKGDTAKKDNQTDPTKSATKAPTSKQQRVPDDIQADRASVQKKLQKRLANEKIPERTKAQRKVMLFSHLHQYEREFSISKDLPTVGGTIPDCIITLGLKYAEGTIVGSNARCIAFLQAMKKVIQDYETPQDKDMSRDLDSKIKPYITFLKQCRPLPVSVGNAIRFLKRQINLLSRDLTESEAKEKLLNAINDFVRENIELAAEQIGNTANKKIRDNDVILTYGCSSLLICVFKKAQSKGTKFRVIVADGRPKFEGREMVRRLVNAGIEVSYIQLTSVPCVLPDVTKVLLGAYAVLANGGVMSRVGTSQVALLAKAANVPVLVCCETYKFSERVQTDSFVFNELGDPDDLIATGRVNLSPLENWRDMKSLCLLNLTYDVTPASLVDAIISELSVIPTTSAPVVLRLKNIDQQPQY